ncbi:MAG: serine/threonine protein kinase [Acidobacteriota bacterium]|nr:serine/threonine protein kinase [Acidobacteriota bacterium]
MSRSAPLAEPTDTPRWWLGLDAGTGLIAATAVAKILGCLVLAAAYQSYLASGLSASIVLLTHVGVFGGAAAFLAAAGARDRRAIHLGAFFLLVAVSFANGIVARLEDLPGSTERVRQALLALHPDAFLPLFLWLFVREFPALRRFDRGQGVQRAFVAAALSTGVVCALASALAGTGRGAMLPGVSTFAWDSPGSWFDVILFGLAIPALLFGLWKARKADLRERRRYSLFMTGLAVGFLPISAQVLAEATSPAYAAFMNVPPRRLLVGLVLYPLLLSIPVTTAYAVLVHRVMDVRLLVRAAVQYAMARFTIVALAAALAVLLVMSLVRNRDLTIGALFTTSEALTTVAPLALLLVVLAVRRPLLERIDRSFFREAVDTRSLLGALATTTEARGGTLESVCGMFVERVQASLHLAQADVLIASASDGWLVSATQRRRPLPLTSTLASSLGAGPDPIVVELDHPGAWVRELPLDEQQWLADADIHLLVPLRSGEELVGALALGEKLNDLPFSRDDQSLLQAVAAALALKLDNLKLRESPSGASGLLAGRQDPGADERPALVCDSCSWVSAATGGRCERCGGPVTSSQLPGLLAGKFRLERQLGRGGMGIVYLAFDTALERRVAIKTLPRVSVAESVRLRREARAMAGFAHPHLALIFGLESWRGAPALVMEYLEGGTLASRLRQSPLPPLEVVHLARDLAGAIALIHDAGLLHRDIKPSNIAFTSARQPKLLDFGLAQIFVAAAPREPRGRRTFDAATWMAGADLTTVDALGRVAGTPAYMAPEAASGHALDGSADLWSLGVVLFECLTGQRPYTALPSESLEVDWAGDLRTRVPDCPSYLSDLVADLLAPDKRKRPSSARAIRVRLEESATLGAA